MAKTRLLISSLHGTTPTLNWSAGGNNPYAISTAVGPFGQIAVAGMNSDSVEGRDFRELGGYALVFDRGRGLNLMVLSSRFPAIDPENLASNERRSVRSQKEDCLRNLFRTPHAFKRNTGD